MPCGTCASVRLFTVFLLSVMHLHAPVGAGVNPAVKSALLDLHAATRGAEWTTPWSSTNGDPCVRQWYGVSCDSSSSFVM